jgi:thiamine biosynthesis protein ThiS
MSQTFRMNGKIEPLDADTVAALLLRKNIDPACRFLAVAVNGAVVLRSNWSATHLWPDDEVEIVRPVSGG